MYSVKLKLQYSKFDQENVSHLAEKWKSWGDLLFEPLSNKLSDEYYKKITDADIVDDTMIRTMMKTVM